MLVNRISFVRETWVLTFFFEEEHNQFLDLAKAAHLEQKLSQSEVSIQGDSVSQSCWKAY